MRLEDVDAVSRSRTYRAIRTFRKWAAASTIASLLGRERLLFAALALLVLASVGAVFASNLGAGIQFLSFALLFVGLAWLTQRFVDPPAE